LRSVTVLDHLFERRRRGEVDVGDPARFKDDEA
jgi:hypothetical protein